MSLAASTYEAAHAATNNPHTAKNVGLLEKFEAASAARSNSVRPSLPRSVGCFTVTQAAYPDGAPPRQLVCSRGALFRAALEDQYVPVLLAVQVLVAEDGCELEAFGS